MAQQIREVMTPEPVTIAATASIADAARVMRETNVGALPVLDGDRVYGIVTDRDLVVRGVALGQDPDRCPVGSICSRELSVVSPDEKVAQAVELMSRMAIRRLPVLDGDRLVGIVSIGDLAFVRARRSALGEISAAPANR